MIANLKPYADYKESGLPWLGPVPGHWEVKRLKNWVAVNARTLSESTPGDYEFVYVDIGSVGTGRLSKNLNRLRFANSPSRARRLLCPGDTIVSTVRTYLKAVFTIDSLSDPMVASTGFAALTPREDTIPRCLGYIAQSEYFTNQVSGESIGIAYPAISETKLANVPITLPPPEEQAAIVRFLDWANGRLERAIRAKRKVIALLNEQKQAIIHRAVTRGLDPSVPLSSNAAFFLERLPTHWDLFRAKLLFRQVVPPIPDGAEMVTCFRDGQVTLRRNRRTTGYTNAIWELGYQGIAPGQLVLHSMDAFAGAIGVSDSSGKCSPEYVICEPASEGVLPDYYALLLRSLALRGLFVTLCPSVRERAPRVRFNDFGSFSLPKPPLSEQRQIVDYLSNVCGGIDSSLAAIRREVDLLNEYRTRLVADVVTGKLDVREAAARLPEEATPDTAEEEADLLDEAEAGDQEAVV